MKLHTHVHHGRKPFVCDTCNKSYTSVSGLKTHWKTHAPCSSSNDEERLARIKEENAAMKSMECSHHHHHHDHHNHPNSKFYKTQKERKIRNLRKIFKGPPETSMDMMSVNGGSVNGQDYPETEETDPEDFEEDEIPDHRRMTVTRVTDHAELADSVLSAQSAPTINLTPISPKFGHHPHHHHHPHQTINDVIEASVKMEQAH